MQTHFMYFKQFFTMTLPNKIKFECGDVSKNVSLTNKIINFSVHSELQKFLRSMLYIES